MSTKVYDFIRRTAGEHGAAFVVLVDPDRLDTDSLPAFCDRCAEANVDAFFVGSSILRRADFDQFCIRLRQHTKIPTIGFPGSITQVSGELDAILFLSIVSGRNADFLIGQHVHAAPTIRRLGIETIPTAYMLVESGATTTAQYMSHSLPLPANKPDVAAATALAAEMLGMKLLFTDAGSGAASPVPVEIVRAISETCSSPIVVGGGMRTPEAVRDRAEAGASVIVVGNALEQRSDLGFLTELGQAAHVAQRRRR